MNTSNVKNNITPVKPQRIAFPLRPKQPSPPPTRYRRLIPNSPPLAPPSEVEAAAILDILKDITIDEKGTSSGKVLKTKISSIEPELYEAQEGS